MHLQWLCRFDAKLWFCVGSVGLVYEHKEPLDPIPFGPWSEYALVSTESLSVEFRRIPFDVDELLGVAHAKDFPGYETLGRDVAALKILQSCDEFDGGFGWIVDEFMARCSHVLVAAGRVWAIDPLVGDGVEDRIRAVGEPASVAAAARPA